MITWKFYSGRKGISLEAYLENIDTYEEAVSLFRDRKMIPPPNLKSFFLERNIVKESAQAPDAPVSNELKVQKPEPKADKKAPSARRAPSRSTSKKTTTRKRSTRKAKAQAPSEPKEPKELEAKTDDKKQYFRKIIKPEKK